MYYRTRRQNFTRCAYTLRHTLVASSHLRVSAQLCSSYSTCSCATPRQFRLSDTNVCKNRNITSCQIHKQ